MSVFISDNCKKLQLELYGKKRYDGCIKGREKFIVMKHSRGKMITAAGLTAAMILGNGISSYAAGWIYDNTGWQYEGEDGAHLVSSWYEDSDSSWYFFNEQGYMISNCYQLIDGNYYPFGMDGKWSGNMFSDIAPGVWTARNYSNEWSGFHLNVPISFQVTTAAETETIGRSDSFIEFIIWTPDGTNSGIKLEYADAYDLSAQENNSVEYMVSMRSMVLALNGYELKDVRTVNLGGKEYLKLETEKAGMIKQDMYCRKVGDHYFECLTAIYWRISEPSVNTLLAAIY